MPNNKRQHYVPKSTLRQFACDPDRKPESRQINLVNISRSKIIRSASLKEQCYRDYFYSQKTAVEIQLSSLEGVYSALTRKMIQSKSIDDRDGWHIVQMVALQKGRTLRAEEEINGMMEKLIKLMMYNRIDESALQFMRIKMSGTAHLNVGQSLIMSPMLLDLRRFLIKNRTKVPFVISDNPVVATNWFCRLRHSDRIGGLSRSGLQLLMPLSPRFALLMHDTGTYSAENDNNVISLKRPDDVHSLNELQWLNAYRNIYFPPTFNDDV